MEEEMDTLGKSQDGVEDELNIPEALVKDNINVLCDYWSYVLG